MSPILGYFQFLREMKFQEFWDVSGLWMSPIFLIFEISTFDYQVSLIFGYLSQFSTHDKYLIFQKHRIFQTSLLFEIFMIFEYCIINFWIFWISGYFFEVPRIFRFLWFSDILDFEVSLLFGQVSRMIEYLKFSRYFGYLNILKVER